MEKASRVMYNIANIFNWIIVLISVAGIVLSILAITHVLPEDSASGLGVTTLVYSIISFLIAIFAVSVVRIAKNKNSSKGWDVLFIVIGVVGGNLFYLLGGIFGLVARR